MQPIFSRIFTQHSRHLTNISREIPFPSTLNKIMQKKWTVPLLITIASLIVMPSGSTITTHSKGRLWQIFPLGPQHKSPGPQSLPHPEEDSKEVADDVLDDVDLADFELEDVVKRQEDDYGHMRFGRSDSYMKINGGRRSEKLFAYL